MDLSMLTMLVFLGVVLFTIDSTSATEQQSLSFGGKHHHHHHHHFRNPRRPYRSWPDEGSRQQSRSGSSSADVVVAQDGSGNYDNIKAALQASLDQRKDGHEKQQFVIYIKSGTYEEHLTISEDMKNIMLIGDGIGNTIITSSHSAGRGDKTWQAGTIVVLGDGFVANDITFQNTAGSQNHQAPAITANSPHAVFYRCSFEGYQDTVYAMHGQQFYRECDIYGTVDFICGDASIIIQNSNIYLRKSETGNQITIATSSRESSDSPTGIVIQNCRIMAAPDLKPVLDSYKIYLGRPWRPYARTIYIQNDFDIPVEKEGWLEWNGGPKSAKNTVDYREYNNKGLGSSTKRRVRWPGYRSITDSNEANEFSVANFIQGDSWLPSTGVTYNSGL